MSGILDYLGIVTFYDWLAQFVGVGALLVAISSFQMKTHKKIVSFQVVSTSLFMTHFLLLGAPTGAILNFIAAIRAVVFANKDKKWGRSNWWMVFFAGLSIIAVIAVWEGYLSLLPMIGMIFTTVSFGIENPKVVRALTLPSSPLWIVYGFINRSYAGVLSECFVMISIIIAIIRLDIPRKSKGKIQ